MKIEKTDYSYQVTECDFKFGERITLDGELLIPASMLYKLKYNLRSLAPHATREDLLDGNPVKEVVWETLVDADNIVNKMIKEVENGKET